MSTIKKISVVCSTGADTYLVGEKRNGKIVSKIERVNRYEDSEGVVFPGRFEVKDKDGNKIAEMSDIVPYVIEFAYNK